MKSKLYHLFVALMLMVLFGHSTLAQNDSLIALINRELVWVHRTNGGYRKIVSVTNLGILNPVRLTYSKASNSIYTLSKASNFERSDLGKITMDGKYIHIGQLHVSTGTLHFAEGLAYNRNNGKLYISGSLDGNTSTGDFYSETILEVDTNTALCTVVRTINTSVPNPEADIITFSDDGVLCFGDGNPSGPNFGKIFTMPLTGSAAATEIYNSSYFPFGGFTIRENHLYYTSSREYISINLSNYQRTIIKTLHSSTAFGGNVNRGLTWLELCKRKDTTFHLSLCPRQKLMLTASRSGNSYRWSDPSITSSSSEINEPGVYWVDIYNGSCVDRDTFVVTLTANLSLDLGRDTSICTHTSIQLDAFNPGASYLWSDGSTQATNTISAESQTWVEVSLNGCSIRDTIDVAFIEPLSLYLGEDTSLCLGNRITLNINNTNATLLWENGSNSPTRPISSPGLYHVTLSNQCESITDSIQIDFEDCDCFIHIPNAFSPNGDDKHELFEPYIDCAIQDYEFLVFNRWGECLFKSTEINEKWNGVYMGKVVPQGVYIYVLNYRTHKRNHLLGGNITVLR